MRPGRNAPVPKIFYFKDSFKMMHFHHRGAAIGLKRAARKTVPAKFETKKTLDSFTESRGSKRA
jgi:hypothetical protein